MTDSKPVVWLISDDLFFLPNVRAQAERAGLDCRLVGDPSATAIPDDFRGALIDLQSPIDWKAFVAKLRIERPGARFVAFGPHVAGDLLDEAAAAGCARVVTKGQLHRDGAAILAEFA